MMGHDGRGADRHRQHRVWAVTLLAILLCTLSAAAQAAGVRKMRADLVTLWDMTKARQTPLDVQVVSSRVEDGVRIEEVYFSSEMTEKGPHRIFCGVARPDTTKAVPVLLELHGGGGHGTAERAEWMAKHLGVFAISLDWGGAVPPGPKEHTNWATYPDGQGLPPLGPEAGPHRVVTAARRALDYAATQPNVNMSKIVCYGGSWGSYHALIVAGTDPRVTDLVAIAGAGDWRDSYSICAYGIQLLPPDQRDAWLRTYDPLVYAPSTAADTTFIMYTNDSFFFYDGVQRNFRAIAGKKRLITTPNNDHSIGGHPEPVATYPAAVPVLRYHFYGEGPFPEVIDGTLRARKERYSWKARGAAMKGALYFSPSRAQWRSSYWLEIPAQLEGDRWHAELPAIFAGVGGRVYVTMFDAAGRASSTLVRERRGSDPRTDAGPLWPGGALWDTQAAGLAWRPSVYHKFARIESTAPGSIRIVPGADDPHFLVLTDSVVLASGHASRSRGVRLAVDGEGHPGSLTVQLWRDGPRQPKPVVYTAKVDYGAERTEVDIPWSEFRGPEGATPEPYPFDTLALEGDRSEGRGLLVPAIELW